VFDNLVEHNVSDGNGVAGQGAGILVAGGGPDTAAYGNLISHNEASGNGPSGVTIHQHFVGNPNGNVIEFNQLSNDNNNVDGDSDFVPTTPTRPTSWSLLRIQTRTSRRSRSRAR
jgi:hypothetical protein